MSKDGFKAEAQGQHASRMPNAITGPSLHAHNYRGLGRALSVRIRAWARRACSETIAARGLRRDYLGEPAGARRTGSLQHREGETHPPAAPRRRSESHRSETVRVPWPTRDNRRASVQSHGWSPDESVADQQRFVRVLTNVESRV